MHPAPSGGSKFLFLKQGRLPLLLTGLLSTFVLLVGNVFFILSHPVFFAYGIFVALIFFYLAISYFVGFLGEDFNFERHRFLTAKWLDRSDDAAVDIFLPICGEPYELIRNTWEYVYNLRAAHTNVRVFVLDDKPGAQTDYNLKTLAEKFAFSYITRETNELKKAGNLRNAFAKTSGEFILILDADFCPRRDFLIETLPYMFEDSNTAIVQTPQFFNVYPGQRWLQRGAGTVQELFYRLIQVNRNKHNGAICVGTNAIYRRSALAPFGGTAPIQYSEDVHTGFQLISNGHRIEYVPLNLAEGACPDRLQGFFTQQYRWALGSISLFFSRKFWTANISTMQRICYLSGMFFYITTGLGVILTMVPSVLMLSLFPGKIVWYSLVFSLPSLAFGTLFMIYWQKLPFSLSQLTVRHVSYFAHLFALVDFLRGGLEEWKPTGAKTKSSRFDIFKAVYCGHTVLTYSLIFGLIVIRILEGYPAVNFALLTLTSALHLTIAYPAMRDLLTEKE